MTKYVTVTVPYVAPPAEIPRLTVSSNFVRARFGCPVHITYILDPKPEKATCSFSGTHYENIFGADNTAVVLKSLEDPETFTVVCDTESGQITSSVSVGTGPSCNPATD